MSQPLSNNAMRRSDRRRAKEAKKRQREKDRLAKMSPAEQAYENRRETLEAEMRRRGLLR